MGALAWASVTVPITINNVDASGSSFSTFSCPTGTNSTAGDTWAIWVAGFNPGAGTITSVTDTGGDTFSAKTARGTTDPYGQWWYATNIAGATNDIVTAHFSANFQFLAIYCYGIHCSPGPCVLDSINIGPGTQSGGTILTFTGITTAVAHEVVLGASGTGGGSCGVPHATAGYTVVQDAQSLGITAYQIFSTTQSGVSLALTCDSGPTTMVGAVIGVEEGTAAGTLTPAHGSTF